MKKVFCCLVLVVFCLPFGVFAKEYELRDIEGKFIKVVDGDKINFNYGDYGFCDLSGVSFYFDYFYYDGYVYDSHFEPSIPFNRVINYNYDKLFLSNFNDLKDSIEPCFHKIPVDSEVDFENLDSIDPYGNDDFWFYDIPSTEVCYGSEEYNNLVKVLEKKANRVEVAFMSEYLTLCYDSIRAVAKFPKDKISLNLAYLNVFNATKSSIETNPISYVKEDGTVVLKSLEREGYKFEGWYLDKNYQYRVTELTQELADDYFSDSGHFSDIEKTPVEEIDGELIGKIDLYAKWSEEKKIVNPETLSTIGIIGFISLMVLAGFLVFYMSKKESKVN